MNNCKYKRLVKLFTCDDWPFFFVTVFGGLDQMFGLILWTLEHIMFNMSNIIIELFLLSYRFWGAPYEITKILLVCDLSHEHPLKHLTEFYFYNVRHLSHGRHFSKFLIFSTSVT
jgi:hypothetical protein